MPPKTTSSTQTLKDKLAGAPDLQTIANKLSASLPPTNTMGATTSTGNVTLTGLTSQLKSLVSGVPDLSALAGKPNTTSLPASDVIISSPSFPSM